MKSKVEHSNHTIGAVLRTAQESTEDRKRLPEEGIEELRSKARDIIKRRSVGI